MTFAIHLYPIKMIESTTIYRFDPTVPKVPTDGVPPLGAGAYDRGGSVPKVPTAGTFGTPIPVYIMIPKGPVGHRYFHRILSLRSIRKLIIRSIHSSPQSRDSSRAGGTYGVVSLSTALRQSQQNQRFNESELVIKRLSKIEGLGRSTIARYLNYMGLTPSTRIRDLTKYQEDRLYDDLDKWLKSCNLLIGSAHREAKSSQLQKLRAIQSYRGLRNAKGLPARGQNTKSNGRTKRKLRIK